jgi:hypothetical protein
VVTTNGDTPGRLFSYTIHPARFSADFTSRKVICRRIFGRAGYCFRIPVPVLKLPKYPANFCTYLKFFINTNAKLCLVRKKSYVKRKGCSGFPAGKPFFRYPVSGRIPDSTAGYLAGYRMSKNGQISYPGNFKKPVKSYENISF